MSAQESVRPTPTGLLAGQSGDAPPPVGESIGRAPNWPIIAALGLSLAAVTLVWAFRILPLYDYPVWLFESRIFSDLLSGGAVYGNFYELHIGPIPNAAFTVLVALLGSVMSIEVAGKIFLSVCVLGFPWGLWFTVRILSQDPRHPAAFLGFPFMLHYFLLGSQNYSLALAAVVWFVGLVLLSSRRSAASYGLGGAIAVAAIYLTHGVMYAVLLAIVAGFLLVSWRNEGTYARKLVMMTLPSLILLNLYLAARRGGDGEMGAWNAMTLARNIVKPYMIFFRTAGVDLPVPLTILNAGWMITLCACIVMVVASAVRARRTDIRFLTPALLCGAAMLALPDPTFEIVQPGARFALPLLCCVVFLAARGELHRRWTVVLLGWSAIMLLYNAVYFSRFAGIAEQLLGDLQETVDSRRPVGSLGFDWSPEGRSWETMAPSLNGLPFVPRYLNLTGTNPAEIFETGLITMKPALRHMYPRIQGGTVQEWYQSVFADTTRFLTFAAVIVFGTGTEARNAAVRLEQLGFSSVRQRNTWNILRRP